MSKKKQSPYRTNPAVWRFALESVGSVAARFIEPYGLGIRQCHGICAGRHATVTALPNQPRQTALLQGRQRSQRQLRGALASER